MNDSDPFDEGQQLLLSTIVGVSIRVMVVAVMRKIMIIVMLILTVFC